MRTNPLRSVLLASALLIGAPLSVQAACELPSQRPLQTKAEFSPLMDTQLFVDSVVSALGDSFMGYVLILQSRTGSIIAEINQGYARNPCEERGAQSFTKNTTVSWGSITKLVTAAATIDRIERSRRQSLADKMADYLPHRWEIGDAWKPVTIRNLLAYQGGFDKSKGKGNLRVRVGRDDIEHTVGSRLYDNANYSAFHYMGAFFGGVGWREVEDGYNSNEIAYDDYIWTHTRLLWKKVLNARIFNPLGIKGDCDKIDFNGTNYALYYLAPSSEKGYFINPEDQHNCTSGGMVMSPRDMGVFLYALTHSDKIISHENYESLMGEGVAKTRDLVGWNDREAVAGGNAYWKDGTAHPKGTHIPGNTARGELHNYAIAFPNGMSALFVSNSGKVGGDPERGPRRILLDTYDAAVAAGNPRRRPGRD